jgi:PAS domain-containing protein
MKRDPDLKTIINAIPSAIFIVNQNLQIIDINQAASEFYGAGSDAILKKLCGEVLHCLHERKSEAGCGTTAHCPDCVIRISVELATRGNTVSRQKHEMKIQRGSKLETAYLLISAAPLEYDGERLALLTIDDITQITELKNLLRICAECKKIKRDDKLWENLESYLRKHSDIRFSHSICPDCSRKLYASLNSNDDHW